MGFISQEKPYYDLGINGYLPENTDFHKQTIPNWEKYINILDRMDRQEELVYIPTAISRTNHIMRAHEFDKDGNNLESLLVVPNFYDPNKLRTSLNTHVREVQSLISCSGTTSLVNHTLRPKTLNSKKLLIRRLTSSMVESKTTSSLLVKL